MFTNISMTIPIWCGLCTLHANLPPFRVIVHDYGNHIPNHTLTHSSCSSNTRNSHSPAVDSSVPRQLSKLVDQGLICIVVWKFTDTSFPNPKNIFVSTSILEYFYEARIFWASLRNAVIVSTPCPYCINRHDFQKLKFRAADTQSPAYPTIGLPFNPIS